MHRRVFHFAIVLLWLALPLVALQYRQVWEQLPVHVATHFNAAGQANGWMSREQAIDFGVGFMAFLLVLFTALLLYAARSGAGAFSWALLAFCTLVLGFMVEVNRSIVSYNLHGTPLQLEGMLVAIPIAAIPLIAVYVVSKREAPLPSSGGTATELLVEETHSGRAWSLLVVPAMIGPVIGLWLANPAAVWPAIIAVGVGFCVMAMTWSGFQYRFLQHGVEIRMLGFHLRSIPRQSIVSYSIEPWAFVRGYGIRGIGRSRAYVWCNKVVHITTSNGDIFLGHNDPERIVRDLDLVTGTVTQSHSSQSAR
jgi:Protein of unknown function (DUF1648)